MPADSIVQEFLLSDPQIGLMTGVAFAVCYTLMSLPIARLADQGSPRLVLISCILVWSAMIARKILPRGGAWRSSCSSWASRWAR